ncbi:MAG: hypothetical protein PW788_09355 [Micavibrio sp.]|nr:hypothetical protein [Micavibrio sp.]
MYIFYDTETSGLDRDFSQIFQVALVFTDDDMNILSSKKLDCRRSPWVIPSPGALLTTGFTPDDLKNAKSSAFEMMQDLDQWSRAQYWPVVFAGYNSLGYDEDILAQNLHSNLLDPGLTTALSKSNGLANGRLDVMNVVKVMQAYAPGKLKLDDLNDFGYPSLALGMVARQNGVNLGKDDAHDALNDIKATIGVAKVIQKQAPALWNQMANLATIEGVDEFISKTKVFTHALMAYGKTKAAVTTAVTPRGDGSATEVLFDLGFDPAPFQKMTVEELKQVFADQDKKPARGQPANPKPFRLVRKNSQPVLMPLDQSAVVLPPGFDPALADARADAIKADVQFQQRLATAAALAKQDKTATATNAPVTNKPQPEQQIAEQPTPATKAKLEQWMKDFHGTSSWKDAADQIDVFYKKFEQELKDEPAIRRFVQFAGRIVFEHAPEELSADKQDKMKRYVAAHVLHPDTNVAWMTVAKARKELDQIEHERASGKKKWQEITDTQIRSLKLYYTSIEKEYAPFLPLQPGNDNGFAQQPPKAANDGFKP